MLRCSLEIFRIQDLPDRNSLLHGTFFLKLKLKLNSEHPTSLNTFDGYSSCITYLCYLHECILVRIYTRG